MATNTDDRPSIAELQRIDWPETVLLSNEMVALRAAAPALLEIVAAAQAWDDYKGPDRIHEIELLVAAIRKVRP